MSETEKGIKYLEERIERLERFVGFPLKDALAEEIANVVVTWRSGVADKRALIQMIEKVLDRALHWREA